MKYYKLYEPISKKMYGTFPNFKTDLDDNFYKPNAILKKPLFIGNDIEMLVPKLFQYKKSSKITDILNSSYFITSVISIKLKKIIEKFKVFEMSFFETNYTTLDAKKLNYYFVKPKYEALDSIDYNKTEFYEWENIGRMNKSKKKALIFKDKKALLAYEKSKKPNYEILKLAIKENWDYDFFALKMVEDNVLCFIVSEKLKEAIEEGGSTGVGFLELNTFA